MVSFNADSTVGGQGNSFTQVARKSPDAGLAVLFKDRFDHELTVLHERDTSTQREVIDGIKQRIARYEESLDIADTFLREDKPKAELEFQEAELREKFAAGDFNEFDSILEALKEEGVKMKHLNPFLSRLLYDALPDKLSKEAYASLENRIKNENGAKIYFGIPKGVNVEQFFERILSGEKNLGRELTDNILGRIDPQVYKIFLFDIASKKTTGLDKEVLVKDFRTMDRLLRIVGNNEEVTGMTYAALAVNGSRNTLLVELIERYAPEKIMKGMPIEPGISY